MRKIYALFYTFEEMRELLRRCCFTHGEDFDIEVTDRYFWKINHYPDNSDDECLSISDYDALPILSKVVDMPLSNSHVGHNGIWFGGPGCHINGKPGNSSRRRR